MPEIPDSDQEMAADFLRTHGIDLDAELARLQDQNPPLPERAATIEDSLKTSTRQPVHKIANVSLPNKPANTTWDITVHEAKISTITPHNPSTTTSNELDGQGALLTPSLCNPHLHLDKAYLFSHPKYSHLRPSQGDFKEAMSLTTEAKSQFEHWDLLERGRRVLTESVEAGVTHMRAFVEVDAGVGRTCLDAGCALREEWRGRCEVQICAFAQLALFSRTPGDEDGSVIRGLMREAVGRAEVGAVGSTPYVEADREKGERNVEFMVALAIEKGKHLDFHLDYNLDAEMEPMVWYVIQSLKKQAFASRNPGKTIVLGHCTRLTLFTKSEWQKLKEAIGDLPVSFVGLPTSDMFMQGATGTINPLALIREHGLNACLGTNNVGNAFTPHGSWDPLALACMGVGVYSAKTEAEAEVLFECVSTRARKAIGVGDGDAEGEGEVGLEVKVGGRADLVLFTAEREEWWTRRRVAEAVQLYDGARGRRGMLGGLLTGEGERR